MEKIKTRTAEISLIEPRIVRVKFDEGIQIDAPDIFENIEASLKLTSGKRHAAVLDARSNVSITDEAMKFGASQKALEHRIATALLTRSLSVRLFGNLFNNFFRPKIQNKIFSDEKDALKWLKSFSEK